MAIINAGEKFRVYLENEWGLLLEADAISASITMSAEAIDVTAWGEEDRSFISGLQKTEINLIGIGPMVWTSPDELLRKKKSAVEWKCEWCGNINPREARHCGEKNKHAVGCGAARSFIYDY